MVKCKTFLTILAVLVAIFYTFIPNLTHDNDITAIERVANFITWTIISVDHFIHCTINGQIYYSVDFNENPHSVAEYAFHFAERVRLWAHANELEKWRNDHGGRNYDMWTIEAEELLSKPLNERIQLFQEKTQNYQKPVIIKHWANRTVLDNWHLRKVARNYADEEVSVRQWEEGCELGHIDKTYRKSLNCELHHQNLKSALDNMLGNETYKYGLAHTIVGHQSAMQKHIFDDFNIIEAFKLFTVFNSSYIPSFVPDNIKQGLFTFGEKIIEYLPSDFQKMRINMFDEMTAFFATPTYWYQSVKKYRPEELKQAEEGEIEFVRRQGAQLHNAFLGNIFANVEGRKLWLFVSPEYSVYLRSMSTSYGFATFSFLQHYLFKDHFGLNSSNFSNVDGYYNKNKQDYERFRDSLFNEEYQVIDPNGTYEKISKYSSFSHMRAVYETIPKYEILLEEGDILYFPPFWWHCVKNYESPNSDEYDYEHAMNFAIANRLIITFKALEVNYFDWFHSVFLFSFKQLKSALWGVEVNMPKID